MILSDTMNNQVGIETNIRSTNRELKLGPMEGEVVIDTAGRTTKQRFQGQSSLMARMDPQTNLWTFQYKSKGLLPEALQGSFTSFSKAYAFAENYFARRNIQITEILD